MEDTSKAEKYLKYWYALRRYKWVIIFPTVSFSLIYFDLSRTLKYKAEKAKLAAAVAY